MKKFLEQYVIPKSELGQAAVEGAVIGCAISLACHLGLRAAHAIVDAL